MIATSPSLPIAGDDQDLLRAYVLDHDRAALEQLVRRHIGFVYACALRQVQHDAHLAEDVTQAVFILLASKARTIRGGGVLRGWLFSATRYAAQNAMKMESRRRYHERHAASQRPDRVAMESTDTDLVPLLDDAISRLSATDRAGVLLSFFDNKTFREVGAALGVSEEAARKRVTRAIDKMRAFFNSRGVDVRDGAALAQYVTSSAAALGAIALPVGLVESTIAASWSATTAFASLSAGGGSTAVTIAKGAGKMIALAKLKAAAAIAAVCLAAGGIGVAAIADVGPGADRAPATQPAAAAPAGSLVARFDDRVTVEVLGITRWGAKGKPWWGADGGTIDAPCDTDLNVGEITGHTHLLCLRVSEIPADGAVVWTIPSRGWTSTPATKDGNPIDGAQAFVCAFGDDPAITMTCRIATGPWDTAIEQQPGDNFTCKETELGGVAMGPTYDANGAAHVTVSFSSTAAQGRVVAIDSTGAEHVGHAGLSGSTRSFTQMNVVFDLPSEQIDKLLLQLRPYDHVATFKNVSLVANQRTHVEVTMTTGEEAAKKK